MESTMSFNVYNYPYVISVHICCAKLENGISDSNTLTIGNYIP
jgi:hypothetical protein